MVNNLSLGTAQFGFNYGVTNKNGKVPEREVNKIINKAIKKYKVY